MSALPSGTVTFLFTDIEGSTSLLNQHPDAYRAAVRRHHDLLLQAVEAAGGAVFETVGDAVYAAFSRPTDAVKAAIAGQIALHREPWDKTPIRVRMGVHVGEAELQGDHYFGAPLYRCARLMSTAHGGQTVLSDALAGLVEGALPDGAALRDLGEHRLKDLARPERIWQLTHPSLPADFPPLRSLDNRPNNLPVQVTSFVGRQQEMSEVRRFLTVAKPRLLTLVGSGGTGQTRLSYQAAADALDEYPDGVWVVELAGLSDPAAVPQAVASAVGLSHVRDDGSGSLLAAACAYLRPRRTLIVLDNCEHLIDACAALVDGVIRACPNVQVLATSREPLGIAGETTWRVPSLTLPDANHLPPLETLTQFEAVRLFLDRAESVQPGFAITKANAPAIAQLCHRLDGIPLAIELAAARITMLPVEQLVGRLEDRFRVLGSGSRTALPRHRTLQALVDWSYDLLADREKTLFNRLSVFAGGWTLEAAEAVVGDDPLESWEVFELLAHLVDKSLVAAEREPDGTARYRLLETLRQYGHQRLLASGEAQAVRQRHAAYYVAMVETAEAELRGPRLVTWLDRLEAEYGNLRAALQLAEDRGDDEFRRRLAGGLWVFWEVRGLWTEGRSVLAGVLPRPGARVGAPTAALAKALQGAGALAFYQGDYAVSRALLQESLDVYRGLGDPRGVAWTLVYFGWMANDSGRCEEALGLLEEGLAVARGAGERLGEAWLLARLGLTHFFLGRLPEAVPLIREASALSRSLGDSVGTAWTEHLIAWAHVFAGQGSLEEAQRLEDASIEVWRALGDKRNLAFSLLPVAAAYLMQGEAAAARERLAEALPLQMEIGDRFGATLSLSCCVVLAALEGNPERAVCLEGAALAVAEATGIERPFAAIQGLIDGELPRVHASLGDAARAAALARGRALSLEGAVAYALERAADMSIEDATSIHDDMTLLGLRAPRSPSHATT